MKLFPSIALFLGVCVLPSLAASGDLGGPGGPTSSDDGVKSSLTALHLNLSSSKAIPVKRAWEKAFALELAVRDVSAQISRYKSYYNEDPSEVASGEAAALVAKAYQLSLSLERAGNEPRPISHASRIRAYAFKMNMVLPAADPDHVAIAHSK